jgi:hypothetical protein
MAIKTPSHFKCQASHETQLCIPVTVILEIPRKEVVQALKEQYP